MARKTCVGLDEEQSTARQLIFSLLRMELIDVEIINRYCDGLAQEQLETRAVES
jgi:hypothetical protein